MKKQHIVIGVLILVLGLSFLGILIGCGQSQQGSSGTGGSGGGDGGGGTTTVALSSVFNVSGAKAIVSATSASSTKGLSKSGTATPDDILKLTASGELVSIFSSQLVYTPQITVIEKGPDGSLYIGFSSAIYVMPTTTTTPTGETGTGTGESRIGTGEGGTGSGEGGNKTTSRLRKADSTITPTPTNPYESAQKIGAFFRIKPDGSAEVVDPDVEGLGTWYSAGSNYSELPAKVVQFDSSGNVYYLGMSSSSGGSMSSNVLKVKTVNGAITTIGNTSTMWVRDFLVCPNGFVLFHGSEANNWSVEWLRTFMVKSNGETGGSYPVFSNDTSQGSYGYLRTYYLDKNNNVYLVGSSLNLEDPDSGLEKKYSGVIRVKLNSSTGSPTSLEVLYDDNNMYSDAYSSIGNQLFYGYWDGSEYKKFFKSSSTTPATTPDLPLSLEAGVTESSIRSYIRGKYQSTTLDTLDDVTFAGFTTTETWNAASSLDSLISSHISGTTWRQWRVDNGLSDSTGMSVARFGDAKQVLFAEDGSVYMVLKLDSWGSSVTKGDKILRIVNSSGNPEMTVFPQDSSFKAITKARCYGNYIIYLSSKVSRSKIFRVDISGSASAPVDLTADKASVVIYSFNYNSTTSTLIYDVYDNTNNKCYLVEQAITSTTGTDQKEASGYTIQDVVPFQATN